jgi:hypothetical protein
LRLLQVEPTDTIRVAIYYGLPQRYDVYYEGQYISPTNAAVNDQGQDIMNPPIFPGHYVPALTDAVGSNFFDNDYNLLYIVMRGDTPFEVHMTEVLVVAFSLPAMTTDEFFGENIISNLAIFLGISEDQIRIVEAVSESVKRRKRNVATFSVILQIGDPPAATIDTSDTTESNMTSNATTTPSPTGATFANATTAAAAPYTALSLEMLATLSDIITDAVQTSTFAAVLNATVLSVEVTSLPPEPGTPEWDEFIADVDAGNATVASAPVPVPTTLVIVQQPENDAECLRFTRQPWLRFLDADVSF